MVYGRAESAARSAAVRAQTAVQGDWRSTLARSGLVAKGVLYGALGVLAIQVALGDTSSDAASTRGAIELIASQPFGQWTLGLLTFGLFGLAIWQFILAAKGDPVEGSEAKDRAKYAGKAIIYLGTAITALSAWLSQMGSASGGAVPTGAGGSEDQATAVVMSWPGGAWLIGILGLAVIGAGIYQLYQHTANKKFMERLARAQMSDTVETNVERAGRAGYAARAVVFAIVGVFLIVAAVQHDPSEAMGLSGALQVMAQQTWGRVVLWMVAVGLVLYGAFCIAEAKYRRAT
jgi:hypothetical protein